MKSKLNQTDYHSILQHHVIPSGTRLLGQWFLLMLDNNPKYTSQACQRYIKTKEEQHIFQLMSWPEQSADINPIELVLEGFDRNVRVKQPTNATHFWLHWQESFLRVAKYFSFVMYIYIYIYISFVNELFVRIILSKPEIIRLRTIK